MLRNCSTFSGVNSSSNGKCMYIAVVILGFMIFDSIKYIGSCIIENTIFVSKLLNASSNVMRRSAIFTTLLLLNSKFDCLNNLNLMFLVSGKYFGSLALVSTSTLYPLLSSSYSSSCVSLSLPPTTSRCGCISIMDMEYTSFGMFESRKYSLISP